MGGFCMNRYVKQAGYFLIIMLLLPYVVTVFVNGNGVLMVQNTGSPYVKVERDGITKQMSLEEYGIGVLAKEIRIEASEETLKAQAVLIRTSIYKSIQEEGSGTILKKDYWTKEQMESNWGMKSYSENYEKLQNAWKDTEGTVILYEGSLALTPYHRLSNGRTRSGKEVLGEDGYPYLQIKECPGDVEAKEAMTTSLIQETGFQITEQDSAGYVKKVKCGEEEISGEEFRSTYHLISSSFVLQDFDGKTRVISQGIGHGLGMSQYTAELMAREGKDYREILSYFFEGTNLEEVAEILVKPE